MFYIWARLTVMLPHFFRIVWKLLMNNRGRQGVEEDEDYLLEEGTIEMDSGGDREAPQRAWSRVSRVLSTTVRACDKAALVYTYHSPFISFLAENRPFILLSTHCYPVQSFSLFTREARKCNSYSSTISTLWLRRIHSGYRRIFHRPFRG